MSKSTLSVCPAQTFNNTCVHTEIQRYQLVSNDMWLSPGVIALSLNKTIDWSSLWTEKWCPEICINLRYQISHASQIHILGMLAHWVDFEMYIHVWSLKCKRFFKPKYVCQKDIFTCKYENSPCGFWPLTSATVILPKKPNVYIATSDCSNDNLWMSH